MAPTLVQHPFAEDQFTSLEEHASQTPATFFSSTAVLHLRCPQAKLRLPKQAYASHEVFSGLRSEAVADESNESVEVHAVDVWVTSNSLGVYQNESSNGFQIDYPAIIVHGQQGESIMLELSMAQDDDLQNSEGDDELIQLHIIPDAVFPIAPDSAAQLNGHAKHASALALYKAIEACQELNPSPAEDEDDLDAEGPTFPGSGGWITSDNAHDFLDEDGQFKPPESWTEAQGGASLGPGAGQTRSANDDDDDDLETETKWQRTG